MKMRINDVYTAYVAWNNGGKNRPILILKEDADNVYFYRITTKYKNKSRAMKAIRYPIVDWQKVGLNRKSYVVIDRPYQVKISLAEFNYVGRLTANDIEGLKNFITNYQNRQKSKSKQ